MSDQNPDQPTPAVEGSPEVESPTTPEVTPEPVGTPEAVPEESTPEETA